MAQTLSLNILPNLKTVMHSITRNYDFAVKFSQIALKSNESEAKADNDDYQESVKFAIPFIKDIDGKTALHYSLEEKTENTRVAEFFFHELLPNMPLDHHGREIADLLPKCVKRNIKTLGFYLDSRFITTK